MVNKELLIKFKKNNIIQRTISALILAPIVLYAIYIGDIAFNSLVLLLSALVILEAFKIIYKNKKITTNQRIMWQVVSVVYAILPALSFIYLRNIEDIGRFIIFWIVIIVWATDIGGYVVGIIAGGPKILPSISPSKSWFGFIGGILFAIIANFFIHIFYTEKNYFMTMHFTIITSVISQIGDFLQSAFKRIFGVKDSGSLIPGHGGVMDRIDGLIFATLFLAIYFILQSTGV